MKVYIRPGKWEGGDLEGARGYTIGDGGKWVQDERFAVRVARTATWSELVTAVAAAEEARDYSVSDASAPSPPSLFALCSSLLAARSLLLAPLSWLLAPGCSTVCSLPLAPACTLQTFRDCLQCAFVC